MSRLNFQLEKTATGSRARAARFRTLHNEVLTPLFMPVGTHATVRGQRFETLLDTGSQILLANTYHLLLRPGPEVFKKFKGIHNFMKWPKSVLTDSGGFQIFAMPNDRHMSEEGAKFLSYVDGKHVLLTPEHSIETQLAIGSDIMMVLDQCVPSTVDESVARHAMELSCRWALRSLEARGDSPQSMFAIVQGACYENLRKESAAFLTQHPFDGFALGGLAVGESKQEREDTVEFAASLLPAERPRYLMGVGTPIDLLEAVHRGMDMFDCIIPTAHSEQGCAYTWKGKVLLRRGVYKEVEDPIDKNCGCFACTTYSKAYLHHLIKTEEPLGRQMVGLHNIYFYHELMRTMRSRILDDTFASFYAQTREKLNASCEEFPVIKPKVNAPKPLELGDFEVVTAPEGFSSIRHKSSGETMHSVIPPAEEAFKLYVEQSRFLERIASEEEVVVWDVGMGAAANVMAAIDAYEKAAAKGEAKAKLTLVSFETDLDSLRLALQYPEKFQYLRHGGPHGILRDGKWESKKFPISWTLLGDFFEHLEEAPPPSLVFFDPFSSKTNHSFWCVETLERIRSRGEQNLSGCELFTYSSSTAVRASLLAAGFYVAKGAPTGPKGETTIALTAPALAWRKADLLGAEWLGKWGRSEARLPLSLADSPAEEWLEKIPRHPQFR
jgi:queuine tRNA-ribosyltransferase